MDFSPLSCAEAVLHSAKQEVRRCKEIHAINKSEIWPKYALNAFLMNLLELSFLNQ
jgi:hypothetical protein